MKNYVVFVKITKYKYINVEAENEEEAKKIADKTDSSEFTDCPDPIWEIDEIIEE